MAVPTVSRRQRRVTKRPDPPAGVLGQGLASGRWVGPGGQAGTTQGLRVQSSIPNDWIFGEVTPGPVPTVGPPRLAVILSAARYTRNQDGSPVYQAFGGR